MCRARNSAALCPASKVHVVIKLILNRPARAAESDQQTNDPSAAVFGISLKQPPPAQWYHFPLTKPVPVKLISRIAKLRAAGIVATAKKPLLGRPSAIAGELVTIAIPTSSTWTWDAYAAGS
jgi:hypothetical protein